MRKYFDRWTLGGVAIAFLIWLAAVPSSTVAGILQAIIPAAVPTANKQGNSVKFQLGTGSPGAGDCAEFDGGGNVAPTGSPCGVGGAGTPGSTLFSSTSSAGPNNTAAETSLVGTVTGSATIAANTFGDGEILEARAQGFFSLPAVADFLTLKMKCGSTVIGTASTTLPAGILTNGTFRFWLMITARGTGAGGSFITNGLAEFSGALLAPSELKVLNTATVAYDFTTSCAFDITAQWGGAQSGELITATNAAAWFPGAPVTSVNGATGAVVTNYQTFQNQGSSLAQRAVVNMTGSGVSCADSGGITVCTIAGATRAFGASFDGGGVALTSGKTFYATIPFACTITGWAIAVDAGTATIDIWKVATGTAIPTISNSITDSHTPAIAANTVIQSTTLTSWTTTSVSVNDVVGISLTAVADATFASLVVTCVQ